MARYSPALGLDEISLLWTCVFLSYALRQDPQSIKARPLSLSVKMAESAIAETAYFHTLNARPFPVPLDSRDPRLPKVSSRLLQLPPEIRYRIYELAFSGNRVVVTAKNGCYCSSETTGPYRADHRWLLTDVSGRVHRVAQNTFIKLALWELHCMKAFNLFLKQLRALNSLSSVRHIRINVFETSREHWELPLNQLPSLRTLTFAPWQKGWTIDIPEQEDSDALSDTSIMGKVHDVLRYKDGYAPVRDLISSHRCFKVFFIFPIRFWLPGKLPAESRPRCWQLQIWRADFDSNTIDRNWREVHLVQEATLD